MGLKSSLKIKDSRIKQKLVCDFIFKYINNKLCEIHNKGGKCKAWFVHGFHFRKIMTGLTEQLESDPRVFAADHLVLPKILSAHVRNSYMN